MAYLSQRGKWSLREVKRFDGDHALCEQLSLAWSPSNLIPHHILCVLTSRLGPGKHHAPPDRRPPPSSRAYPPSLLVTFPQSCTSPVTANCHLWWYHFSQRFWNVSLGDTGRWVAVTMALSQQIPERLTSGSVAVGSAGNPDCGSPCELSWLYTEIPAQGTSRVWGRGRDIALSWMVEASRRKVHCMGTIKRMSPCKTRCLISCSATGPWLGRWVALQPPATCRINNLPHPGLQVEGQ